MNITEKLREILLPVLGLETIDEIKPSDSLVNDLDADSIDFVEIIYLIEQNFKVVLKTSEIIVGGVNSEDLFIDGRLTEDGAELLNNKLKNSGSKYQEGLTKVELFSTITVSDLSHIVELKIKEGKENA